MEGKHYYEEKAKILWEMRVRRANTSTKVFKTPKGKNGKVKVLSKDEIAALYGDCHEQFFAA
jgi:hypothetical protein